MRALDRDWRLTLQDAGATATASQINAAGTDLLRRWRQPHRRYHDVEHLAEVLDALDTLIGSTGDATGGATGDPTAVRLAAWFHDAVYDGRPGDDEEASAQLAEQVLSRLGVPGARVRAVTRLVRLTARHDPAPGDHDGAVLCDADLAILAAPADRYARYAAAVRAEYAQVPDDAFRAGRAAVLRALAAGPLYRTAPARRRWEQAARQNLDGELAQLDG